ncbi:hypothetical protein Tco_0711162 [Tanacetum coccineum]
MTSLVIRGDQDDREGTPPLIKVQIEGHIYALKSLIKDHNKKNTVDPIWLDFELEDTKAKGNGIMKGKTTLDGSARGWFERHPTNSINELAELREAFSARYSIRRARFKEPHEITKTARKYNESLTTFKERWIVEIGFIMGVPEVMKIASFMDSLKCWTILSALKKISPRWNFPRVKLTSILGGHFFQWSRGTIVPTEITKGKFRRNDDQGNPKGRENYGANRGRDNRASYPHSRGDYLGRAVPVLTLGSLTKPQKEILATKTQLRLPPSKPMLNP